MPSVRVDLNNLPKGKEVSIPYLGTFKNGSTTDVDDAKWKRYTALFPGAASLGDSEKVEITTDSQKKATEDHRTAKETAAKVESGEDVKKDELQTAVAASGGTTSGKNKDELKEQLTKNSEE